MLLQGHEWDIKGVISLYKGGSEKLLSDSRIASGPHNQLVSL